MTPETPRKLYRSRSDRKLAGVAGGLAEYFDTDPNLMRAILFVGSLLVAGPFAILLYLALILIIPAEPRSPALTATVV